MVEVTNLVTERAKQFGIKIQEVRIKKADLPSENSEAIYRRMQTERQQEAAQIRAIGEEKSRVIQAEAEKNKTVILAEAKRDSRFKRRRRCWKKNFRKAFVRIRFSLQSNVLSKALTEGDTTMVLSPKGEFFEFFRDAEGKN